MVSQYLKELSIYQEKLRYSKQRKSYTQCKSDTHEPQKAGFFLRDSNINVFTQASSLSSETK